MFRNVNELIAFEKASPSQDFHKAFEDNEKDITSLFATTDDFIKAYEEAPRLALRLLESKPDKFVPILKSRVILNVDHLIAFLKRCKNDCKNYFSPLTNEFVRSNPDLITKIFKSPDAVIKFTNDLGIIYFEVLIKTNPRYFINLFDSNFKGQAMDLLASTSCNAYLYLNSLTRIVQEEKRKSALFYNRGAVFGLFNNIIPCEVAAIIGGYLSLQEGRRVAQACKSARDFAEDESSIYEIKIGRF